MVEKRSNFAMASSVQTVEASSTILAVGGLFDLKSAEMFKDHQEWYSVKYAPGTMSSHCLVPLNSNQFLAVGGKINETVNAKQAFTL